jgi:hypothetical protein
MKLTEINQIWLEKAANELGTKPVTVLNAIIRNIRERCDRTQDFEHWVKTAGTVQLFTEQELADIRETRVVAEEAVRAARLYLERVNSEIYSPS